MRIAVVSDIHGNLTAFEAIMADLKKTSPDLIFHGGDLADFGSSPVEIVDRIRDLGWQGVAGNGEQGLSQPETLENFARQSSAPPSLWAAVREVMAATREKLGKERLDWLSTFRLVQTCGPMALVHASPEDCWAAPGQNASDAKLASVYEQLGLPIVVYGHVHCSYIRRLPRITVTNAGSVGLSYDGDTRAAYFLLDGLQPTIRRVQYDVTREVMALRSCGLPHADWVARTIQKASPQMP